MSEYWKSTPKYWCKHCSTYVKDTPFERKQHENTGKHQGNLKRFLRGIQNDHEKGERDKERARAEVDRLNRVVGAPVSSSAAAGPSTAKSGTTRKAPAAPTAVDQKRQWAQLADMGIQVPENFRAEMAMPGQWQTISTGTDISSVSEDPLSVGVRKRKVDEDEEEAAVEAVRRRGWGTAIKRYPEDDDPDLDALLSETVIKKESLSRTEPDPEMTEPVIRNNESQSLAEAADAIAHPPGLETENTVEAQGTALPINQAGIKKENVGLDGRTALTDIPQDVAAPLFKKRKVKPKTETLTG